MKISITVYLTIFISIFDLGYSKKLTNLSYSGKMWFGNTAYLYNSLLLPNQHYSTTEFGVSGQFLKNIRTYLNISNFAEIDIHDYSNNYTETGLQFRHLGSYNNQYYGGLVFSTTQFKEKFEQYNSYTMAVYIEWKK